MHALFCVQKYRIRAAINVFFDNFFNLSCGHFEQMLFGELGLSLI